MWNNCHTASATVLCLLLNNTLRQDHITLFLCQLHWLPVQRRVEFKIACLAHQSLTSTAPTYLTSENTFIQDLEIAAHCDSWLLCTIQILLFTYCDDSAANQRCCKYLLCKYIIIIVIFIHLSANNSANICSVLQPSSIRWLATPRTYFLHLFLSAVILTDSSMGSPAHVLMLSIQEAMHGLPGLRTPGIVPYIISFSLFPPGVTIVC